MAGSEDLVALRIAVTALQAWGHREALSMRHAELPRGDRSIAPRADTVGQSCAG